MKTKTNKSSKLIIFSVLFALCLSFGMFFGLGTTKAYAATTNKYRLQYNYSAILNGINQPGVSGTSYNYAPKISATSNSEFVVYLYGDSNNGTVSDLPIGSILNFSKINISTTLTMKSITVKNSSGTAVYTGSGTSASFALSDGSYTISINYVWTRTQRGVTTTWSYTFASSIVVDTTAPTGVIKNSSGTTLTSSYTNGAFYYTATDSNGVSYMQYMTPGSSSWVTYSGSTIAATATNGTYKFRAVDKAGNVSGEKSIYLDTTNPVGVLYSGSSAVSSGAKSTASYIKFVGSDAASGLNTVYVKAPGSSSYATYSNGAQMTTNGTYSFYCIDNVGNQSATYTISLDNVVPTLSISKGQFGGTLSDSFTVSASDNIGGTVLYYKNAGSSSYTQASGTSTTISKTSPNGTYSFYAVDGYGNTSAPYSVTLSISAPVAQIVRSSSGTQVCVIWTDSTASGKLNGNSYVNGTWIKEEGNHTFVLTNDAGRSSTYTFSIDHYYVKTTTTAPTCTSDGYSTYKCDNCGNTYNADIVPALGHNYVVIQKIESTCTAEGYSVYKCSRCGATYNDDIVSANGHDYGGWKTIKEPTCTGAGEKRRDCIGCSAYETQSIAPTGHSYVKTDTAPSCTAEGYSTYTCSKCNDTYTDGVVSAVGHNYVATVTKPTCTERGFTTQKCSRCSNSYVENYVNANGHSYGVWRTTKAATCTDGGLRYKTCSVCSYKYNEGIPALGHSYEAEITAPTCVDKGYTTHLCSRCGTGYNDTFVDALGHNYQAKRVEPTCTDEGYIGQCCSRCSDTYKTDVLRATGHDYVEIYKNPTCTEEGCVQHICLVCQYEYKTDVVNPTGHSLESNLLLVATCTVDGERLYQCTKCDYERIDIIPKLGHNYQIVEEKMENGVVKRHYECSVCKEILTQDVGDQYEKVSNYVTYLFEEYSPYMMWVFIATAGVWSIAMGIAIIIANKNEDKAKAKKMLVNYGIGLVVIFAILVAVPYLVQGVAALVAG